MSPRVYAEQNGMTRQAVMYQIQAGKLDAEQIAGAWVVKGAKSTSDGVQNIVESEGVQNDILDEGAKEPKVGKTPLSFYDQVVEREYGKLYLTDEFHTLNDGRKIQLRRRAKEPKPGWVE